MEREETRLRLECRQDVENLLMWAVAYDKHPNEKPGEFYDRIKSRLKHPEKLKASHFPHFMGKN